MPRPVIRLSGSPAEQRPGLMSPSAPAGLKVSTARRSPQYLRALHEADLHRCQSHLELAELVAAVRQEFDSKWSQVPIGLVAHCYLGLPFETHMLSMDGGIIEHFEHLQALPGRLDAARPYARTEQFEVIEVYPDRLVCVRADGTTMTLEG